jgi:hypothetical protein
MPDDKVKIPHGRFKGEYSKDSIMALIAAAKKESLDPNTLLAVALQESNFGTTRNDYGVAQNPIYDDKIGNFTDELNAIWEKLYKRTGKEFLMSKESYERAWENRNKDSQSANYIQDLHSINNDEESLSLLNSMWKAESNLDASYQEYIDWTDRTPREERLAQVLKQKIEYAKKLGYKDEAKQIQAFNGLGVLQGREVSHYGIKGNIDMRDTPVYGNRIKELRENVIKINPQIQKLVNGNGSL